MRIIAGAWKSRRLVAPATDATRPTSDRVRETIFDILANVIEWEGCTVIDAFAGSGALGLEALSRGAAQATFVEKNRNAILALRNNIAELQCAGRCSVIQKDAIAVASSGAVRADVIFADPPYKFPDIERFVTSVFEHHLFARAFILEHGLHMVPPKPDVTWKERIIGDTSVTIWLHDA
jgi:16S rRNA (guanine966-N2)-methyltransferase